MAVRIADKIKQSNDADFYLLDAADVEMANGQSLEEKISELESSGGSSSGTLTIVDDNEGHIILKMS